eukprot:365362-Chlamydomonas_euryale.AAC.10
MRGGRTQDRRAVNPSRPLFANAPAAYVTAAGRYRHRRSSHTLSPGRQRLTRQRAEGLCSPVRARAGGDGRGGERFRHEHPRAAAAVDATHGDAQRLGCAGACGKVRRRVFEAAVAGHHWSGDGNQPA